MAPNKKGRLKVEYVPIRSVKPAKGNTRQHPPEQIQEIARSIEAFGWTKPIIVDERREILAGHGAYQAAARPPVAASTRPRCSSGTPRSRPSAARA